MFKTASDDVCTETRPPVSRTEPFQEPRAHQGGAPAPRPLLPLPVERAGIGLIVGAYAAPYLRQSDQSGDRPSLLRLAVIRGCLLLSP